MPSSAWPITSRATTGASGECSRRGRRPSPSDLRRCKPRLYIGYHPIVPRSETLGQRIRRLRQDRGMSLAKVSGGDFSRAFLNQVKLVRTQPAGKYLQDSRRRLGTEVDYLLE